MLRNYRNVLDLSNLGNFCLICFIFAIPDKVTPLKSLHGFVRRRRHCTYPPPCVKSDKNEGKAAVIPKVGKAILFLRTATGNSVRVAGFEILPVPVQWRAVGHWQYNVLDVTTCPFVRPFVCSFVCYQLVNAVLRKRMKWFQCSLALPIHVGIFPVGKSMNGCKGVITNIFVI